MNTYKVIDVIEKTPDTFCLRTERPDIAIRAGQCFNIGIPGLGINREYSMYSDANAPYLEFLIRSVEGGLISQRLRGLTAGDAIEIDGPYGEFCIKPDDLDKKFLFFATGTGVAPFHSFVKTYPGLNYILAHGVRYENERYDFQDYTPNSYISCISSDERAKYRHVTDYISLSAPPLNNLIYLCGNRNMIVDAVELLLQSGVNGNQIITEVFF